MRVSSFLALAASLGSAFATPFERHVLHEKRSLVPDGWTQSYRLDRNTVLPMRIAMTQANIDMIGDYLMEVSDPSSPQWNKHWTSKQIAETFAPSAETIDAISSWLESAGITADRVSRSDSLGWLKFDAKVHEAESLLKTQYHMYEHETGARQVTCDKYHVPEAVRHHVDFITPTVHFDAKVKRGVQPGLEVFEKRQAPGVSELAGKKAAGAEKHPVAPITQAWSFPDVGALEKKLKVCQDYITPACLQALYEIPAATSNVQNNPLGIVEYTPEFFSQSDLDLFFSNFSSKQKQTTPDIEDIDNVGLGSTANPSFGSSGEANLDLEYAMALVNPITVRLYQVGDTVEGASFNNFLDAIDASYCTYEGGDDPTEDGIYPDPYKGGYKGAENCGGFAATKVVSTSYGYSSEHELTLAYQQRQCNEYAKLGLAGTSFLYSSGDSGVAPCLNANGTAFTNGNSGRFAVGFPVNCPYVTAVGATMLKPNTSVTAQNPEEVAYIEEGSGAYFTPGGGFSDFFSTPKYQKSAVKSFFKNYPPPYTAAQFNNTGLSRGVPDVSANGGVYVITVNGTFSGVLGTSCSAPTFASIITIINEQRKAQNKGSLGFLNPSMYNNPTMFTDITSGHNIGCGTDGFSAVPGWDPASGLGTPIVPRMLELYLGMA